MSSSVPDQVESIKRKGDLKAREIAELLGTTPETVSRWHSGRVKPRSEALARLSKLEALVVKLARVWTPYDARLWLFSPHRRLGGDRPLDRIRANKIDDVLALVLHCRQSPPGLGDGTEGTEGDDDGPHGEDRENAEDRENGEDREDPGDPATPRKTREEDS